MHPRTPTPRTPTSHTTFVAVVLAALFAAAAARAAPPPPQDLALVGARVYPAPDAAPLDDAVVLLHAGRIAAVGKRGAVQLPAGARTVDVKGKFIVAGFWNSHVHLIEPIWTDADKAPPAKLQAHLDAMFTRWGFTTVFDLGSSTRDTLAVRARIESRALTGPRILTTTSLFPAGPNPSYLPQSMALPKAKSPEQATALVSATMTASIDGLKLFTGSFQDDKPVINMEPAIVRAAVAVAHAQHKPVFAHPQNRVGLDVAIDGGVDVLAHTAPTAGRFTDDELAHMKARHMALVPTLALWRIVMAGQPAQAAEGLIAAGVRQTHDYFAAGGTILFGTDVGFHDEYDTTHELEYLARALPWTAVLATLTTNPAAYFKVDDAGRIAAGMRGDLVVLDGDPAADARNLARVAQTIRDGRVIYIR